MAGTKNLKVTLVLNINGGFGCFIPLSLLYLGAQLNRNGHETVVLDRRTFSSGDAFLEALRATQSDLIGICLYADGYTTTYRLVNQIRRFDSVPKILVGGPEVTAHRSVVTNVFDNVDYFLAGEAEYTLVKLADCIATGNNEGFNSIEGLSCREDGQLIHIPPPAAIEDVDGIAFPDRDLISPANWKKTYYRPGLGRPSDSILTSRGCPFTCKFCYRTTEGYRARSPENVLEELAQIHKRGSKGLFIIDDNFTLNQKRCTAILEGILERGWKFSIKCRGRVSGMNPDLLKLMKRAGVHSISLGIESGSQKILDTMDKKTTVEQNYKAIRMIIDSGIQCYADMFLGYPGETRETIRETGDFIMRAKPTGILLGALYPLHGTEVFEQAKREGQLIGDWGILQDSPWVKLPWMNDYDDLAREVRMLRRKFYLNPGVLIRGMKANIRHFSPRDYLDVCSSIIQSI